MDMKSGIVVVDKPTTWTSFDVVAKLRRLYGTKKIGHTGTLDPMATGVLCVFLGHATRFISHLPCKDKRYTATVKFGVQTDTGDVTGEVINSTEILPTKEQLQKAINSFIGEITQIPPMYSAIKVDGVPLYKSARAGRQVDVPPRQVTIHQLVLLNYDGEVATLDIKCSEGSYVRTLAEDIATHCGSLATLADLRRTEAGAFDLSQSHTVEEIERCEERQATLLSVESAFLTVPMLEVTPLQLQRLQNGLTQLVEAEPGVYRVMCEGRFYGLVRRNDENIKAVRLCEY